MRKLCTSPKGMAEHKAPSLFKIVFGTATAEVFFIDEETADEPDWEATNVISEQGVSITVWRNAKKRTAWVVIPVRGGYVVVKITFYKKRSGYQVEMRKIPILRGSSHTPATLR